MGFASAYLSGNTITDKIFQEKPAEDTGIIIVIPAFDEPGIINTLQSLADCEKPPCSVETIVIVNAPSRANRRQLRQNYSTCEALHKWKQTDTGSVFLLLYKDLGIMEDSEWGVGMARKTGMDEALRRFSSLDRRDGVIASLDADCLVQSNYLLRLYTELQVQEKHSACSVYFEHPLEGQMDSVIYSAICRYELHLRYYYQALKYTGYPGVFHTIGSALAVKALSYAKAGGMNRRQGGEDFYFIQKLIPAGGYFYLTGTTVIPSPRISDRVPFGTGPVIGKLLKDPQSDYLTYNPEGFEYIKVLVDNVPDLYNPDSEKEKEVFNDLHFSLQDFLEANGWQNKLAEIRSNTSSPASFEKRFFSWFNMFRVVKYLNFLHTGQYQKKMPVKEAAVLMLRKMGYDSTGSDEAELLNIYRGLEK